MSIFLKIDGITGESSDKNHKGWIDIDYFSWGNQRQITSNTSTQGDRESSNTIISDLILYKHMDKSTPNLFMNACCGGGKEIKIHLSQTGSGSGSNVYAEYTMQNAIIRHYEMAAKSPCRYRPIEEIKISFIRLQIKYIQYDDANQPLAPIATGFNTGTNTKV